MMDAFRLAHFLRALWSDRQRCYGVHAWADWYLLSDRTPGRSHWRLVRYCRRCGHRQAYSAGSTLEERLNDEEKRRIACRGLVRRGLERWAIWFVTGCLIGLVFHYI